MASISGTFRKKLGTSRINGDVLAVENGLPNEFVAATDQANNAGLEDGDGATAMGDPGHVGDKPVFLMTSIQPTFRATAKAAKKKVAKKKVAKKKAAKKKAAKKKARKAKPNTSTGTAKRKRRPKKR